MSNIYRHALHDADARVTAMQNGIVSRQSNPFVTPSHGTRNDWDKKLQGLGMHARWIRYKGVALVVGLS